MDQQVATAFAGANQRSVRQSNRVKIFRALHSLGPIARVELARQSGLNPGTVTNIVDELISSGLVHEVEDKTSIATTRRRRVGRRPVQLQVNPDARFALGIDLARTTITGAVVNLAGEVIHQNEEPTRVLVREEVIGQVVRIVEDLLADLGPDQLEAVVGVGVGAPGAVSFRTGRFQPPPSYGDWEQIDLRREIEKAVGIPTTVDNNANTAALGELWYGAGMGLQNFVLLNLGTGVGAGLVLNGALYRGEHGLAAEIGHMSIAMDGPRCACGNSGCFEMYVSLPRVLASARAALETGEPSALRDGTIDLPKLLAAVQTQDPLALRVLADVARFLAAGIVNITNMLDPQVVLIGRELADAGDALLNPVREEVRRRVLPVLRSTVRIEAARLTDAPVIGAGVLGMQQFFESPV